MALIEEVDRKSKGMDSRSKAARERQIEQLAIEIERRGGDSDAFAAECLRDMVLQSPRQGEKTMTALVAEIDAWRRARRTARRHFSSWAPTKRVE
jgi:hypothetical protein